MVDMEIKKASGETEEYKPEKLRESLERVGARSDLVDKIMKKADKQLRRDPHTDPLFNKIRKELASTDPVAGMRYGLKRSLFKLGPFGHPFEYFFADVLTAHGYQTQVGMVVDGHCVPHEIDVIAERDNERIMVESKFHTRPGIRSRLKDSLYIHARYLDVRDEHPENAKECFLVEPTTKEELEKSTTHVVHERAYSQGGGHAERGFTSGMLVTNTKVTFDGRMYAACSGLRVVSWRYPSDESLEHLIESKRVYPVTIFSELSKEALQALFDHQIYTIQRFLEVPPNKLAQGLKLSRRQVSFLQDAARMLVEA